MSAGKFFRQLIKSPSIYDPIPVKMIGAPNVDVAAVTVTPMPHEAGSGLTFHGAMREM